MKDSSVPTTWKQDLLKFSYQNFTFMICYVSTHNIDRWFFHQQVKLLALSYKASVDFRRNRSQLMGMWYWWAIPQTGTVLIYPTQILTSEQGPDSEDIRDGNKTSRLKIQTFKTFKPQTVPKTMNCNHWVRKMKGVVNKDYKTELIMFIINCITKNLWSNM